MGNPDGSGIRRAGGRNEPWIMHLQGGSLWNMVMITCCDGQCLLYISVQSQVVPHASLAALLIRGPIRLGTLAPITASPHRTRSS